MLFISYGMHQIKKDEMGRAHMREKTYAYRDLVRKSEGTMSL
jgi:hypothetical protein